MKCKAKFSRLVAITTTCVLLSCLIREAQSSSGDLSPYYQQCTVSCKANECTAGGRSFPPQYKQPWYLALLFWDCENECRYGCMWDTVQAFHRRGWSTPQFHGKWPFTRWLGVQEPASSLFSVLNLCVHWANWTKFRQSVRRDSPMFYIWSVFIMVNLIGWTCSTVFHARDVNITEFLDYAGAFAIVIFTCFSMMMRVCKNTRSFFRLIITCVFMSFFLNHTAYLYIGAFDYNYNMKVNLFLGISTAVLAFGWSLYNRKRMPHVWKCAAFFALLGSAMLLEIFDFPPVFDTFDSHSLWHLASAPITYLFYGFIIDDCKYLRKQKSESDENDLHFHIT